jgi:hypothetical protein
MNTPRSTDHAKVMRVSRRRSFSNWATELVVSWFVALIVVALALGVTLAAIAVAQSRDLDGRYLNSPLRQWFERLESEKGLCCSFSDGEVVEDFDWDVRDGHYRVRLRGYWVTVPDEAVVRQPNKFGPAVVWPYPGLDDETMILCFMPGSLS